MREFLDYLDDILDAMNKAEQFTSGLTFEQFEQDDKINFATVRALEIIGEAVRRIPEKIKEEYPKIPWKNIAGMRDRIIHGYDTVNLLMVWNVIKNDIPDLRLLIQQILNDYTKIE